jgi:hypothetical protein
MLAGKVEDPKLVNTYFLEMDQQIYLQYIGYLQTESPFLVEVVVIVIVTG